MNTSDEALQKEAERIVAAYCARFDSEEPSKFEMVTFFNVYLVDSLRSVRDAERARCAGILKAARGNVLMTRQENELLDKIAADMENQS